MALSSDPYEQRLYQMFQAHDVDSCGRLDRESLVKLCHTLELKERGHLLVRCLLGGEEAGSKRQQKNQKQQQQQRVTFKEFREGLLHILGGEEQSQQQQGGDSSDGHQIVSTAGSPTSSSSGSSLQASITSHTSTAKHLHLPSSHHSHRKSAAGGDSNKLEPVTESVVVISSSSGSSSNTVPSGEDDLGATTTTPVTTTPSNLIINTTTTTAATTDNDNEESSDREVSPKFVVGTKKYGRRSRPRQDLGNGFDTSSDFSNSDNESVPVPGAQQDQQHQPVEDAASAAAAGKSSSKVQRSASQSDIHGSKRRRPMGGSRLKRCASLPTHRQRPADLKLTQARIARDQLNMEHDKIDKKIYFMKLSENLREIWDSLVGNGHGDLLNQSQLEVVCERVGLQKLPARLAAQEVFVKLSLQPIEGISFDEFISLLQSNSDILPITPSNNPTSFSEEPPTTPHEELDRDSVEETVGFTLLPPMPDWTAEIGSLAASIIVDMWESAGVAEPRQLLHELGFYGEELQVAELVAALDDEQQRLGEGSDQQEGIMRASLALHKAEVAALRQAFVQLVEENKKLYSDNKEVNHRATLLAQEVDERHNSLENSTRAKIRLLEQRHHETVKELTSQLAFEREQLSCANAVLEKRIQALEAEDGKAKAEIVRLAEENDGLRVEQENLVKELTELLEKNIKLNKDIAELEENNRNDLDDGFDRKDDLEVLELIEKISILQDENTQLRDKNDEFTAEIESLNLELAKFKLKRSGISRTSSLEASPGVVGGDSGIGEESSSAARKRQGDSPSKARLSDESPRLGKFRKCSNDLENESDSSGDWMALQSELGIRVDSGITSSGISQDYSIVSESSGKEEEIRLLKAKVAELEKKLEDKKTSTDGSSTVETEKSGEDSDPSKKLNPEKLKARCDELEASMEQLSKEYEACEDYWQSKLNEERQLYEEEQRIADDKFNELLKKMAEYEEQFAGQAGSSSKSEDGRLSPIEEKDVLEQQYLDLEAEFQQAQQMLEEKSHEVEKFRCRILELEQMAKYPSEAMLATPPRIETPEMDSPASSPISYLWNQSTIQAPATRDYQNPNWCQPLKVTTTTSSSPGSAAAAQNATDDGSKSPLPPAAKTMDQLTVEEEPGFSRTISPIQKPSSASSVTAGNSTTDVASCGGGGLLQDEVGDCSDVCSVKSARSTHSLASTHSIHKSVSQTDVAMVSQEQLKHQRLMQLQLQDEIKELTHQRDCLKMEFQQMTEVKPFLERSYNKTAAHPNLTQKIQHLENKNRHLNGMLKQQQAYSEQILHRIWQHQRSEIAEMSNRLEAQSIVIADQAKRLASNDILVKDLYVENTHLAAQVQRLEQQKVRATLLQQYTQAAAAASAASGNGHPHPHQQLSGIVPGLP